MHARHRVRRLIVLLGTLAAVLVLAAACAAPAPAAAPAVEGPRTGGTLTLSFGDDFVTFHPFFDVNNADFKPIFFEAPIRISADGGFEPWLAESWDVSDDGLAITLHLREGVMFHNGREMTADDVVWSATLAMDEEPGHHLADRFGTAVNAEKIDERTVVIHYSERNASQLDGIARLYIYPQEAAGSIEIAPVGTGPFKFVEWIPGDSVTAERFEDYWQEGLPYLDRVVIRAIPDAQARLVNLRSQSIDLLYYVPLVEKPALETTAGMVVGDAPEGFSFYAFLMNINAPPFDNVLVRQAFQFAINRQEIADTAFHGQAKPVTIPLASTSWAYATDLEDTYTYNPERAKELLAEAGYPEGFSIELLIRGAGDPHLDQAQVFQQQLAAIGVDVTLVPTELPQYWPRLFASDFAIVSHKTGDATVDPSGLFEGAACCRPFRNFFGVQDRSEEWFLEYHDLIMQARVETDQAVRTDLYHRALEIWQEQAWTIPTVWEQDVYAHWDYVQGLRTDLDGAIWLQETYVTK